MQTCTKCSTPKTPLSFSQKTANRRSSICKDCHRQYTKQHYIDNKQTYLISARATQKRFRETARVIVRAAKDVPCADCRKKYHYCAMDFDHLHSKKFNVSRLEKFTSLKKLKEEIAKCQVVCANCHRIRTHARSLGATEDAAGSNPAGLKTMRVRVPQRAPAGLSPTGRGRGLKIPQV